MNAIGLLFALATAGMVLALPRRWAPLPFIVGATYMPMGQEITVGPFHFTIVRILVAAGYLRVMLKGERPAGGLTRLDRIMIFWAATAIFTGLFHEDPSAALIYRLGLVYDALGIFLLFRIFVQEHEDLLRICKIICILMVPVAMGMMVEKSTGTNCFGLLFGDSTGAEFRNGRFRGRGPFIHAIFAGTIGAVCLPMALYLWRAERTLALTGLAATGAIVFASGSSGPIMTLLTVIVAMVLWSQRRNLPIIRWLTVLSIVALALVMNDPVYYLLARIDITGGSTGYHRAALIQAAIEHFDEWWLVGTDYTRHWLAAGIPANNRSVDITNHYIAMGVMGGMPLMLAFVWVLAATFTAIIQALRLSQNEPSYEQFMIWILGSILFAHATTFISISYFGQAVFFFYLLLGCIGCLQAILPAYATSPDFDDEQASISAGTEFAKSA
jgi:hypothetical protein